ncbi:MAG TPA: MFS transporter [Thermoprotei archaeon]|nr:MFS transporter [Thermoprotei archaeon]
MHNASSTRKLGLDFGVISGAEWLIIIAAFLGRYLLQFYQTTIQELGYAFGMNSFEVGIGFALFTLAFAASAVLMHKFRPSQLRTVEIISLSLLGITMPLYMITKGISEAYTLMAIDGFIVGLVMDSFMTMAGMASLEQSKRQVEQSAFSFWVALALIVAPFTTGYFLGIGIIKLFLIFAVMAFVAIPFVLALRGKYSLKYVEKSGEGAGSVRSLFKNREFNWAIIAAMGYTIPFFSLMSFGVRYGRMIGFSPSTVFYLLAIMFTGDVIMRFIIRLKSPITNRYPYMVAALSFATLAAFFLYASYYVAPLYYLAFLLGGIPDGIAWTLGLQIANTSFKSGQIVTATSFFSSSMMILSALMPVVGLMASMKDVGFVTAFLILAVVTLAFLLVELAMRPSRSNIVATMPVTASATSKPDAKERINR